MSSRTISEQYHAYYEDGLAEIALGAAFAGLGAWFMLENLVYMAWMMPWMFIAIILPKVKEQVAGPRGGVVQPPTARAPMRFKRIIMFGLLTLVLVGLVFATAAQRDAAWFQPVVAAIRLLADHFALVMGIVIAAVLAFQGYVSATQRLYVFAGVAVVSGFVADLAIASGRMGGLALGLAVGVPMIVAGSVHYRRFCQTHPLLEDQIAM